MFSEFHETKGATLQRSWLALSLSKIPKLQVVSAAFYLRDLCIFYVYIYIYSIYQCTLPQSLIIRVLLKLERSAFG